MIACSSVGPSNHRFLAPAPPILSPTYHLSFGLLCVDPEIRKKVSYLDPSLCHTKSSSLRPQRENKAGHAFHMIALDVRLQVPEELSKQRVRIYAYSCPCGERPGPLLGRSPPLALGRGEKALHTEFLFPFDPDAEYLFVIDRAATERLALGSKDGNLGSTRRDAGELGRTITSIPENDLPHPPPRAVARTPGSNTPAPQDDSHATPDYGILSSVSLPRVDPPAPPLDHDVLLTWTVRQRRVLQSQMMTCHVFLETPAHEQCETALATLSARFDIRFSPHVNLLVHIPDRLSDEWGSVELALGYTRLPDESFSAQNAAQTVGGVGGQRPDMTALSPKDPTSLTERRLPPPGRSPPPRFFPMLAGRAKRGEVLALAVPLPLLEFLYDQLRVCPVLRMCRQGRGEMADGCYYAVLAPPHGIPPDGQVTRGLKFFSVLSPALIAASWQAWQSWQSWQRALTAGDLVVSRPSHALLGSEETCTSAQSTAGAGDEPGGGLVSGHSAVGQSHAPRDPSSASPLAEELVPLLPPEPRLPNDSPGTTGGCEAAPPSARASKLAASAHSAPGLETPRGRAGSRRGSGVAKLGSPTNPAQESLDRQNEGSPRFRHTTDLRPVLSVRLTSQFLTPCTDLAILESLKILVHFYLDCGFSSISEYPFPPRGHGDPGPADARSTATGRCFSRRTNEYYSSLAYCVPALLRTLSAVPVLMGPSFIGNALLPEKEASVTRVTHSPRNVTDIRESLLYLAPPSALVSSNALKGVLRFAEPGVGNAIIDFLSSFLSALAEKVEGQFDAYTHVLVIVCGSGKSLRDSVGRLLDEFHALWFVFVCLGPVSEEFYLTARPWERRNVHIISAFRESLDQPLEQPLEEGALDVLRALAAFARCSFRNEFPGPNQPPCYCGVQTEKRGRR